MNPATKFPSWAAALLFCAFGSAQAMESADAHGTGMAALKNYAKSLSGERKEAAGFLLANLPEMDRESLSVKLFRENLEEAYAARTTYPWTKALPKDLFFNDVLPHAVVVETRAPWRRHLRTLFAPLLGDARSVQDAARIVGANIGRLTGVKYNKNREKACQSPTESMRQGMASCTGLSILMIDSLRACGVPARMAAIPMWGTMDGNHTWVEIHDGETWRKTDFGGTPKRWDKGWAVARCAYSNPRLPIHGIFASTYRTTRIEFPMAWDWDFSQLKGRRIHLSDISREKRSPDGDLVALNWPLQRSFVPGIDRTAHYIALAGGPKLPIPRGSACVTVKAFKGATSERAAVPVRIFSGGRLLYQGQTASPDQDLNDCIRLLCTPGPLRNEHQTPDGKWIAREIKAKPNKETPVKISI
jgi:hypothetical protein